MTFLLLFLMTGSVLVPIKALLLNALSLTATFGAMVWVFQEGRFTDLLGYTPTGAIDIFTPLLMFCIAFGLSMDYEVFLLSRIKEEYDYDHDNERAVAVGLGKTGHIVTAAALGAHDRVPRADHVGGRAGEAVRPRARAGGARRRVPDPRHARARDHAAVGPRELVGAAVGAALAPPLRHLGAGADQDPRPRVREGFRASGRSASEAIAA